MGVMNSSKLCQHYQTILMGSHDYSKASMGRFSNANRSEVLVEVTLYVSEALKRFLSAVETDLIMNNCSKEEMIVAIKGCMILPKLLQILMTAPTCTAIPVIKSYLTKMDSLVPEISVTYVGKELLFDYIMENLDLLPNSKELILEKLKTIDSECGDDEELRSRLGLPRAPLTNALNYVAKNVSTFNRMSKFQNQMMVNFSQHRPVGKPISARSIGVI